MPKRPPGADSFNRADINADFRRPHRRRIEGDGKRNVDAVLSPDQMHGVPLQRNIALRSVAGLDRRCSENRGIHHLHQRKGVRIRRLRRLIRRCWQRCATAGPAKNNSARASAGPST